MEKHFYEIFNLCPDATREQIRKAYHRLARQNHPDLFPEDKRAYQELRMIALNEAYAHLMHNRLGLDEQRQEPTQADASTRSVGYHRDPAYAYYKQGFVNFSRAVNGIMSLTAAGRNDAEEHRLVPLAEDMKRFTKSLLLLRNAFEYFTKVVHEYADSPWRKDADLKLYRIDRFTTLYRRILDNINRRAGRRPTR